MCPACISLTTLVLTAAGAGSAGGLTAWAVKHLGKKPVEPETASPTEKPR